jgi:hypothetical protein
MWKVGRIDSSDKLLASRILNRTISLHVRGPECEVVPQELHDERGVLVTVFIQRVKFRNGIVEGLRTQIKMLFHS